MSHEHHHTFTPSEHATVMLDIGDGVGALVVHTPSSMGGLEIDINRRGEATAFVHTAVRERRLPHGSVYAAVYPELPEGDYTLIDVDGRAHRDVHVESGRVTEIDWST
jgi:hypothetical protein